MNDREKLIEIIGLTEYGNGALVGKNFQRGFIGKIADHLIANGVTVQKWIPVSERLPEVPVGFVQIQVIIFCESGVELAWFQIDTEEFYDTHGWLGTSVSGVTHWMPIPRPPKGE